MPPLAVRNTTRAIAAVLLAASIGCASHPEQTPSTLLRRPVLAPQPTTTPTPAPTPTGEVSEGTSDLPTMPADGFYPAASQTPVTMRGTIEHMGWTKSGESWEAGGSDYYVLVRDDLAADAPQYQRRVILRASPNFKSLDDLKPLAGQHVEIQGRHAGSIKFRPDPMSPYPGELDKDGYLSRGGGLLIDTVSPSPLK